MVNNAILISERGVTLSGNTIENNADITAKYGNISFDAINSVKNKGNINGYDLSVSAKDVINDGKIDVSGSVSFTGDNIENNNTITSTGTNYYDKVEFNATNSIKNNADIVGRRVSLNAQNNINNIANITSSSYTDFTAKDIINTGNLKANDNDVTLTATNTLKNDGQIEAYSINITFIFY